MREARSVLPDLSIRQLEYLLAVAKSPTWATAADRVGVSASALSQGLAELERRVGVPLFDRHGRRRSIRPAAEPVLAHARQVVSITGDLARWAERTRSGNQGTLRLGMIDVAAINHYPELLRSFRADHPDVAFHLRVAPSGDLLAQLGSGQLDLVVCVEPRSAIEGIATEPLLTEKLGIYRPDGKRAGPPSSWGPWVLFPDGSQTRMVIAEALRTAGAPMEVVAESHQPDVLREMVLLGLGWTVLPVAQAADGPRPLARGRILTTRRLATAIRSGAVVDPAVEALRRALLAA